MKRRSLLAGVGIGVLAAGGVALTGGVASASGTAATATDDTTVEPQGGAGLFDVDPDQGDISQDPNVAVTGDVAALPDDWGF